MSGRRRSPSAEAGAPSPVSPPRQTRKPRAAYDADGTRSRILSAATSEFANSGYSGARVDAICRAARANPRMIYHYFEDKDGLYLAVLEQALGELRKEEMELVAERATPMEGIMGLFDFIHDHFARHPELISLLTGENLLRGRFLRRSAETPTVASPIIAHVARLLRQGERQRVFRRGVDPLRLYVMIVALGYFHRSNAFTLSVIFRTNVSSRRWRAEYRSDGEAMLRRYLSPDQKSTGPLSRKHSSNSK